MLIVRNKLEIYNFLLVCNHNYMSIGNFLFAVYYTINTICVLILITFPIRFVRIDYIQNSLTYTEIKNTYKKHIFPINTVMKNG